MHTSKHYHTSSETISETNQLVRKFRTEGKAVIALSQESITTDPLWYSYRLSPEISLEVPSRMGEHPLRPVSANSKFTVTFSGGYHSACLGLAVAETIARFAKDPHLSELEIVLPMRTIFTGFFFKSGKLAPSIEFESYADSSVDGQNLSQAIGNLSDQEWLSFLEESLHWAVFIRGPIARTNLSGVAFQIERGIRVLKAPAPAKKLVRFHYL